MIRSFLKKVGLLSDKNAKDKNPTGTVIPRSEHGISRNQISPNAIKVLYRLKNSGYDAYLVGGGVRDLLLGLHPKDFDVVTNATPEEIKGVFRNCRLIGRRFRLAHIYFGYDIVEVATFRGKLDVTSEHVSHSEQGMLIRDNVYGTLAEDVWRRDFTINAIYYNIADFSLVDFVGGYEDLKARRLRIIGDPSTRYREDPVRMLRAIRFACKGGFELSKELTVPMHDMKNLISHISGARLFEEIIKMFHSGVAAKVYENLKEYHLFAELFPATAESLAKASHPTDTLLKIVFHNTDERVRQGKTLTPAFIFAALLWHPILARAQTYTNDGIAAFPAKTKAIEDLIYRQAKRINAPKRIVQAARDIWLLQLRMSRRFGKRVQALMEEPRFRAAFDFLEMRAQAGENVQELASWWKDYIEADDETRARMMRALSGKKKKRKKKKRRDDQKSE